jgi:hypothetical protein
MSQVGKSASAFVRAFLAILVLELEDMVVRMVRPPKLAGVHGYRWTVRLGISVEVSRLAPVLARKDWPLPSKPAPDQIKGLAGRPICSLAEAVYLERAKKLAHKTVIERLVAVARSKNVSPTWSNVRVALRHFDRAGLLGLVQDLYTASKDEQALLHALSLSQTLSDWRLAANRVKLLPDDRALRTDLVRADWIVPIAGLAGNRDPSASCAWPRGTAKP